VPDPGAEIGPLLTRVKSRFQMALGSTLYHFEIALSDTDRGIYRSLDLRAARHPSETVRYLLTRVMALCLLWDEGIGFSRGLSTTDEPAVWTREPDGRIRLWVDIGHPSAERLHKASKASQRVVVVTENPDAVKRAATGARIHRAEKIEVLAAPSALLDALEERTDRHCRWEAVHTGGSLYVTMDGQTEEGAFVRSYLVEE
jgi:uncharacterized protein YaeQ